MGTSAVGGWVGSRSRKLLCLTHQLGQDRNEESGGLAGT
jgi:hypothetical protein